MDTYLNFSGSVGQSLGFRMKGGSTPSASMLHQSSFCSSEKTKAWPYPWMVPGASGYFSFFSRGSMKNSRDTASIASSKPSSIPWFTTYVYMYNQYHISLINFKHIYSLILFVNQSKSRSINTCLEEAPLLTGGS
jgi:hypothetical protein